MSDSPIELPHEPAPPEPGRLVPDRPLLLRGTGLAAVSVAASWLGLSSARKSWLFAPFALACGAVAVLAGWAAAIHLTGGEKFDDHPFI